MFPFRRSLPPETPRTHAWQARVRTIFRDSLDTLSLADQAALARARRHALAAIPAAGTARGRNWHPSAHPRWRAGLGLATSMALVLSVMAPIVPGEVEANGLVESALVTRYHGPAFAAEEPDFELWSTELGPAEPVASPAS